MLDAAQLEVLRRYGSEHNVAAGDVLFADGDVSYDLIVVLAGRVRIIERHGQPGETVIATYGPLGNVSLVAEVSDDLQPPTEGFDVGGQASQFSVMPGLAC